MNERIPFRLGDLLGLSPACAFLSEDEIVAWSEGRLPPERNVAWQEHARSCASCTELADDLDVLKLATDGLTVSGEARAFADRDRAMRTTLGLDRKRRAKWPFFVSWLVPAAIVSVLAAVFFWPSPEFLIADIEQVPLVPPPAVRGSAVGHHWDNVEQVWSTGNDEAAEAALLDAFTEHPTNADFALYLGLARMNLEQWPAAVEALEQADSLQADAPSATTRWMLATALDRAGRRARACTVLESIASSGGRRSENARQIIDDACP